MNETALRTFVVEDEPVARNYLVELLTQDPAVQVVGAVGSLRDVAAHGYAALAAEVDVVFLDVQLAGGARNVDGLAIARTLAALPNPPLIVFATASPDHAMDAIDLGSTAYLRKPLDQARVAACLARVRAALALRRPQAPPPAPVAQPRLVGRSRTGLVFLPSREVWAIGSEGRLVTLHAAAGTFDVDLSLASLALVLGDAFLRVHRQWLVQVAHTHALERRDGEQVVFVGERLGGPGLWVPIARDRAAEVRQALLASSVGVRS